ncbi:AAA family ATPase [Amycolatopsis sp. NPDC005961]|uniref:AAA family ATPase n=1 Tax=Amycolatopsis sp. NPDC005961 TaxID=3156720 RepID=UPI0033D9AB5A
MRIVVIAGPPCAGKTTLAWQVAGPDDVVLDFDDIARGMGSPVQWLHPEPYRTQGELVLQQAIAEAHAAQGSGTAWVLRTAPRPSSRASLAELWGADVYVLDPSEAECRRRARGRPTGTGSAISSWYHRYRPRRGDLDAVDLVHSHA